MGMVNANKLPEFHRMNDGIRLQLRLGDWPENVPLRDNATIVKLGDGPFRTFRFFHLEPERTIDEIVGWFAVPASLEETFHWYKKTMPELGWLEIKEKTYLAETSAALYYKNAEENTGVRLSFRWWKYLKETTVMISRAHITPWSLEDQPLEEENAPEPETRLQPTPSTGHPALEPETSPT